jgi:hypothetical protein
VLVCGSYVVLTTGEHQQAPLSAGTSSTPSPAEPARVLDRNPSHKNQILAELCVSTMGQCVFVYSTFFTMSSLALSTSKAAIRLLVKRDARLPSSVASSPHATYACLVL